MSAYEFKECVLSVAAKMMAICTGKSQLLVRWAGGGGVEAFSCYKLLPEPRDFTPRLFAGSDLQHTTVRKPAEQVIEPGNFVCTWLVNRTCERVTYNTLPVPL